MSSTKYKARTKLRNSQQQEQHEAIRLLQEAAGGDGRERYDAASVVDEENILDHQRKMNYHNEYDRLRGELGQHILRRERGGVGVKHYTIWGAKRQELEKRVKELEGLGAK